MAKFSDEKVEQIVGEHLGKKRSVKRVDEEELARDSQVSDADLGTPDLNVVQSKYLADWRQIYAATEDSAVSEIDYSAGKGEDVADEIVQVPVSDEDRAGQTKSLIISGDKQKVIGSQG